MATQTTDSPTWPAALGRIPSGLFILTAANGDHSTGMLASWVQQCSFDPPTISVAMRKGRYLLDWLIEGSSFAVNVLGEGQKSMLAHFGKGFELGEPAFEGIDVDRSGAAPVLKAALSHLHLRVVGHCDAGDHVLVLGRVVGGAVHHDGKPTVHTRKSGLHY